ncbi:MAG: alpha/beta hydrolase [Planctomycetota bacterium]|nr:alpha/beta hydrolase [Planctomycetota bacterium]
MCPGTNNKPFQRGPFKDLPERPHQAHIYYETEGIDHELASTQFGPMKVHLRKYGAGPPLLLIHGLMTSSYSWRYVFEKLGQRYTCYAPDLPGAGRSDRPLNVSYGPSDLAQWIGELARSLGIYGCPIIANSMGGYLAMHLALSDVKACSKLVNLHSPGVPELRLHALRLALSTPGSHRLLRWLMARNPRKWAHSNVHYYDESLKSLEEAKEYGDLLGTRSGADAFIKYLSETMNPAPMKAFNALLSERKARGEEFPVPLLLLYANKDPMVPPRFGKIFHTLIPGSIYKELDQASHFAHVDNVEAFLKPVLEFLN